MKIKEGASLAGLQKEMRPALIIAAEVYGKFKQELYVTSGTDGSHSPGSLHYYGFALDLRHKFWVKAERLAVYLTLKQKLPFPFDVVLEKTHIHVEYDFTKLKTMENIMDKKFWQSKKFWMAIVGAVIPAANGLFGLGLDLATIAPIVGSIMSYVVGQGVADLGKNSK